MEIKRAVILGSGNVATNFALGLQKINVEIKEIYSCHKEGAMELSKNLSGVPWTVEAKKLNLDCDIIISMLKDKGAKAVWEKLPITKQLLVHTAGSLGMNELYPYAKRCGVIYPLQSISKNRVINFRELPLFYEANNASDLKSIKNLCEKLSSRVSFANSEQRGNMHLAAVFANNFANAMFMVGYKLMEESGIESKMLDPIMMETAVKAIAQNPFEAQTGPAVRWDENVMKMHLEKLSTTPELQELYRITSKIIKNLTKKG